jgi:Putative auto-transporter adhesin, head GIN domain
MKLLTIATALLLASIGLEAAAQSDPFTGSNKIVTKKYDYTGFQKITFLELDGEIEVEVGKPYAVEASIKDKYTPIFEVEQKGEELVFRFIYTKDNNKYINNPEIKVKISCPSLAEITHVGNSKIYVSLANQATFNLTNSGNGSATLAGQVQQLTLASDGNGQVNAADLSCDTAKAQAAGNGSVTINATRKAKAKRLGNGAIVQKGPAPLSLTTSRR